MANLQVKGIDDRLYAALGERASRDHRSISQEVVALIEEFLARGGTDAMQRTRAFLELAGSWKDDREAEEIAKDLRESRRNRDRSARLSDVFD